MTPDIEQLHRIRALAVKAGLKLRTVDADPFVAAYTPRLYRRYVLPPSFVWLCTICDPDLGMYPGRIDVRMSMRLGRGVAVDGWIRRVTLGP